MYIIMFKELQKMAKNMRKTLGGYIVKTRKTIRSRKSVSTPRKSRSNKTRKSRKSVTITSSLFPSILNK